jgi:hypothetical protein
MVGRRSTGAPRKVSQGYFSLGPNARAIADAYLLDYYARLGDVANYIAADAPDAGAVHATSTATPRPAATTDPLPCRPRPRRSSGYEVPLTGWRKPASGL